MLDVRTALLAFQLPQFVQLSKTADLGQTISAAERLEVVDGGPTAFDPAASKADIVAIFLCYKFGSRSLA